MARAWAEIGLGGGSFPVIWVNISALAVCIPLEPNVVESLITATGRTKRSMKRSIKMRLQNISAVLNERGPVLDRWIQATQPLSKQLKQLIERALPGESRKNRIVGLHDRHGSAVSFPSGR